MKQVNSRKKLLQPIFVLITIMTFFGVSLIYSNFKKMCSLEKLNQQIIFSRTVAQLIHSLQIERGLSSGYIDSGHSLFENDLKERREKTDLFVEKFFKELPKNELLTFNKESLEKNRQLIDKYKMDSKGAIKFYSQLNANLLKIIIDITKRSHIPIITQNLHAYVNFLYLKEYMGIERAMGVSLLSVDKILQRQLVDFTNTVAIKLQNEKMFLNFASDDIKNYYKVIKQQEVFKQVKKIEKFLIYQNLQDLQKITAAYWFKISTKKINILDRVSEYIENIIKAEISKELTTVRTNFIVISLLTVISIMIFISMILSFLKLAKEEQRLRLVSQKYIISSITDLQGRIIDVSDAFCDISGYSREELIGKPHNIVRHPDMPKEVFRDLWETIKSGKSWKGKVKNLKKDGGYYWVYANIEPLYNAQGKIDSYISIRLDITESEKLAEQIKKEEEKRKIAQEMMQQQARLAQMGEMLSMIAHQWRQPLSAITSACGVIYMKASMNKLDKETAIELSNKIKEFSMHLSSTIDDFRNFFKSNKQKQTTTLQKVVNDALKIVKSSLENNQIKLYYNVSAVKELQTFDSELKQVILNFLKNSEDVLKEKEQGSREIHIKVDEYVIELWDNGGGIPEEIMPKIFDPYFSTKEKKDGTGLGLYMSKIIIEDHCHGKINVENIEFKDENGMLQKGAKFTICLKDDENGN